MDINPVPYDEARIHSDDVIIHRINPEFHVKWDANRQCNRISSKAFSPSSGMNGGMSVDIEAKIVEAKCDPRAYVTTPVFTGSVKIGAGHIRELLLWIGYHPLPENPHHGEVWGTTKPNRFTGNQKKGLQAAAEWYVQLDNVDIR